MAAEPKSELVSLYKAKAGRVDLVDVPQFLVLKVEGRGAPDGEAFSQAIGALYSVAYTAKFAMKKATGEAPKIMPLEAFWGIPPADRSQWKWTAMLVQPAPMNTATLKAAVAAAKVKKPNPALDLVQITRFKEGKCAQTLHVGPYANESVTIKLLHSAIAELGLRIRSDHHEIYLSDPFRTAPEKLKTIIRYGVEKS